MFEYAYVSAYKQDINISNKQIFNVIYLKYKIIVKLSHTLIDKNA